MQTRPVVQVGGCKSKLRCFVAVEIPPAQSAALAQVISRARELGVDASFSDPDQLHCTLAFLGEKNEGEVKALALKLAGVSHPRFQVSLQGFGFFPSGSFARVFWAGLRSQGLLKLQESVARAVGARGESGFQPHVTLARIKSKRGLAALVEYAKSAASEVGEFEVGEFKLMQSRLSPSGAVYSELAKFALL